MNVSSVKIDNITGSLYDMENGRFIMSSLSSIPLVSLSEKEMEEEAPRTFDFSRPIVISGQLANDEKISKETIERIIGFDTSQVPDNFNLSWVEYIQIRKHRKKRINKKWMKRYGVRIIIHDSKNWKVISTHTTGDMQEFIFEKGE